MATQLQPQETGIFKIVQAVRELVFGRNNAVGTVTLTAGAVATAVSFVNCSKDSQVFLSPRSANAAAALATTYILPADIVQGGFTITHANTGATDRTFGFTCTGG